MKNYKQKIVIFSDGVKNVEAKLYDANDTLIRQATARCHDCDTFDLLHGIEISLNRVVSGRFTGNCVCFDSKNSTRFTVGKIYAIVDGCMTDNEGKLIRYIKNPQDLWYTQPARFIAILED